MPAARYRSLSLPGGFGSYLRLRRPGRDITRLGLSQSRRTQSRLRCCLTYCKHSPLLLSLILQPESILRHKKIITAGVVNGHVACKYVYVRIFRNSDRMHSRDLIATGSWVAIGFVVWILAWIIAEAIPVFDNLLSLIASLFASWFTCKLRCQRVCIAYADCLL